MSFNGSHDLSKGKSSQSTYVDPNQRKYLDALYGSAKSLYDQSTVDNTVAGFNPTQLAGQEYALGYANQIPGITDQMSMGQQQLMTPTDYNAIANQGAQSSAGTLNALQQAPSGQYGSALNQMMSGNVNLDPYNQVADTITDRMNQNFTENTLPGIRRNSMGASGVNSSRAGIPTGQAARQHQETLGQTLNNLYLPAYQQAQQQMGQGAGLYGDSQNRALAAAGQGLGTLGNATGQYTDNLYRGVGLSNDIVNMGFRPADVYSQVGTQNQALEQTRLDAPWTNLSRYQAGIGAPVTVGHGNSDNWRFAGSFGMGMGGMG